MLLNRLGNKRKLAGDIIPNFLSHDTYVELFFGSGAIFFNKGKAKYNVLNDMDSEVFNVFKVVKERPQDLIDCIEMTPFHHDVLEYFKSTVETDEVWRAVKLLYQSNFTMMGKGYTLKSAPNNFKDILLQNLVATVKYLASSNIVWLNKDYKEVFDVMSAYKHEGRMFVYADPPYIDTENNYNTVEERVTTLWTQDHLRELLDYLCVAGYPFAVSEFNSETLVKIAKEFNLEVTYIKERKNIKTRAEEILITNYKINNLFLKEDL